MVPCDAGHTAATAQPTQQCHHELQRGHEPRAVIERPWARAGSAAARAHGSDCAAASTVERFSADAGSDPPAGAAVKTAAADVAPPPSRKCSPARVVAAVGGSQASSAFHSPACLHSLLTAQLSSCFPFLYLMCNTGRCRPASDEAHCSVVSRMNGMLLADSQESIH